MQAVRSAHDVTRQTCPLNGSGAAPTSPAHVARAHRVHDCALVASLDAAVRWRWRRDPAADAEADRPLKIRAWSATKPPGSVVIPWLGAESAACNLVMLCYCFERRTGVAGRRRCARSEADVKRFSFFLFLLQINEIGKRAFLFSALFFFPLTRLHNSYVVPPYPRLRLSTCDRYANVPHSPVIVFQYSRPPLRTNTK